MLRFALLALLAFGLATPALAQDEAIVSSMPGAAFGKAPVRLVYDHVAQTVALESPGGEVKEVWGRGDDTPFARVPTNRPVVVEVRNANSLLYDYTVTASVVEVVPPRPTCIGRARSFVLAGGLTAGAAFSGGEFPDLAPGDDLSLGDFLENGPLADISGAVSGEVAFPMLDLARVQREGERGVQDLSRLAARLQAAVTMTSDAIGSAARRGDSQPIDPLLAGIQSDLEAVYPGLSDPSQTVAVALEAAEPMRQPIEALLTAADDAGPGAWDASDPLASPLLRLADRARAVTEDAVQAADSLQGLTLRIARARAATRQRTTLRPGGNIREVTIDLARAEAAIEGVRATRQQTLYAFLGPRQGGLECNVAVSLVWTGRPPAYGVSRTGQLVDDAPPELRSSVAVFFEVAPPVVGNVLGLVTGAGIGDGAPDLYLGGSLRPLSPVLLTVGGVWQRTARLPDGLALGSDVEITDTFDEDDYLDAFPRRWTPSLFVGISLIPTR